MVNSRRLRAHPCAMCANHRHEARHFASRHREIRSTLHNAAIRCHRPNMAIANHAILPPTDRLSPIPGYLVRNYVWKMNHNNNENYPDHSTYQVQVGEYHGRRAKASFWVVSGHWAEYRVVGGCTCRKARSRGPLPVAGKPRTGMHRRPLYGHLLTAPRPLSVLPSCPVAGVLVGLSRGDLPQRQRSRSRRAQDL